MSIQSLPAEILDLTFSFLSFDQTYKNQVSKQFLEVSNALLVHQHARYLRESRGISHRIFTQLNTAATLAEHNLSSLIKRTALLVQHLGVAPGDFTEADNVVAGYSSDARAEAVYQAAEHGHQELAKALLEYFNPVDDLGNAVFLAARDGRLEAVRSLLTFGPITREDRTRAAEKAISHDHPKIARLLLHNYPEIAQYVLVSGQWEGPAAFCTGACVGVIGVAALALLTKFYLL